MANPHIHTNYQMPLFERDHIQSVFDRQHARIRKGIVDLGPKIIEADEDALVDKWRTYTELCPIDLDSTPEVECVPNDRGIFYVTSKIPFSGDDEFWYLYPREVLRPLPLGEIFRGHLIFEFIVSDAEVAEEQAEAYLDKVRPILDDQKILIERFASDLPDFIRSEIEKQRVREKAV